MAKKAIEPAADRLKELEAQRQAAEEALQGHRERVEALQAELENAESALRLKDVELGEEVEKLLKSLPPSGGSELLVTELQKFKQSGRAELNEQVLTFQAARRAEAAQVARVEGEIRALSKHIEQEVFDKVAREIHAELADFCERFKVLNGKRFRLFDMVQAAGFNDFAERFKRLGLRFPLSFGVLCESHIAKRNPDGLDVAEIARRLESISQAYGEKPLQLPGTKGMQNPPPMERNWYHNPPPEREN